MIKRRTVLSRPSTDPAASPAWVVTYADLVTLLLCVFVGLFSMSAIRQDRFQTALGSLQSAFGSKNAQDGFEPAKDTLFGRLHADLLSEKDIAEVVQTPRGVRIVLAGPNVFPRGQAEGSERTAAALDRVGSIIHDSTNPIVIYGHCAGEGNANQNDPRDLSYERAAGVARRLEGAGVAKTRVQVVALGDDHPALDHAYTEKRRAMNRRVEIEIVEGSEPGGAGQIVLNR